MTGIPQTSTGPGAGRPPGRGPFPTAPAATRLRTVAPEMRVEPADPSSRRRLYADLNAPPHYLHEPQMFSDRALGSRPFRDLVDAWGTLPAERSAGEATWRARRSSLMQTAAHAPLLPAGASRHRGAAGGGDRGLPPMAPASLANAAFHDTLHHGLRLATAAEAAAGRRWCWHVEATQARLGWGAEAPQLLATGPEAWPRDYSAVMLMRRHAALTGTLSLGAESGKVLHEIRLSQPSALVMVAGRHLWLKTRAQPRSVGWPAGHLDVLVLSFTNLAAPRAGVKGGASSPGGAWSAPQR